MAQKRRQHPKAFTLFELVVVIGVFGIVAVLVVGIFVRTTSSQRREAVSQKALQEIRQVVNTLQQGIMSERIDYSFYKTIECTQNGASPDNLCDLRNPVRVLALVNDEGEKTRFLYDGVTQKLYVCVTNPITNPRNCSPDLSVVNNYISTTPTALTIPSMSFYITPASDYAYQGDSISCSNNNDCSCYKNNMTGPDPAVGCHPATSGVCDTNGFCAKPDVQGAVTITMQLEAQGLGMGNIRIPLQFSTTSRVYVR